MFRMDAWDLVLMLAACYVAVMALTRLMTARRQKLIDEVQHQWQTERTRMKKRREKATQDK